MSGRRTLIFAAGPSADGRRLRPVANGTVQEAEQLRHAVVARLGRRRIISRCLLSRTLRTDVLQS
jgi:hypothetical protein